MRAMQLRWTRVVTSIPRESLIVLLTLTQGPECLTLRARHGISLFPRWTAREISFGRVVSVARKTIQAMELLWTCRETFTSRAALGRPLILILGLESLILRALPLEVAQIST